MPYMELAVLIHIPVFLFSVYQLLKHGPSLLWGALAGLCAVILGRRAIWIAWGAFPEWIDRGLVPVLVSLLVAVIAGAALRTERNGGG